MSNIKCTECGHVIVRCPHCHALLGEDTEEKNGYVFPVIPTMEIDLNENDNIVQQSVEDWNFKTALPEPEVEEIGPSPVLEDFFSHAPVKPSTRKLATDINPNPEINRASIAPTSSGRAPAEYAKHRVKDTYGNYDIEELTKIAVEQQFRQEKRRKRQRKIIWRCVWIGIIIFIIIKNWPWVVYFCKMFFGGWGAVIEIFGLLGDVAATVPTP